MPDLRLARLTSSLLLLSLPFLPAGAAEQGAAPAATDHSQHAGHHMEPWMYKELRERVDVYRTRTDAEIDASMTAMGPDYLSYLSSPDLKGDVGVLVLAHGYGKVGDEAFRQGLKRVAEGYPTAVGFGMSMTSSSHVQEGVDRLTAAGAKQVVVVPALSSSASDDQLRQWQYMFGLAAEPGYMRTPPIHTSAKVTWTPALEDHPLVVGIIADYARELSQNPAKEVVIVVSHGPNLDADNQRNIALLERIAAKLKERDGYAAVRVMSMQNDTPPEQRAANGRKLRAMVEEANRAGQRVIIVTNLQSPKSIQHEVEKDIEGTQYVFGTKGLVQHPNYSRWVAAMVADARQ